MTAEQLIALEAALTELSMLYGAARRFCTLHERAENELLPQLASLGSRLRGLLRTAHLSPPEIDAATIEILSLRSAWRAGLEQVHVSGTYRAAQTALAADQQEELARLLPQLFAGLKVVRPAPALYFPISPATGQRRPGGTPFLGAVECADRIMETLAGGIEAETAGSEWWESEWPCIVCADDAEALETPIALRLAASAVRAAVFSVADEPTLRLFTRCVQAPMSVVLAAEATDEWWLAYEDSYAAFREALQRELTGRGVRVSE